VIIFISIPQIVILEAKITPKRKDAMMITIKKGDTLWSLAKKYYNNPELWPVFKKYNIFTDPHWIYPGEKLAIGYKTARKLDTTLQERLRRLVAEKKAKIKKIIALKEELAKLQQEAAVYKKEASAIIAQKEQELYRLQQEVEEKEDECRMLNSAIQELQVKLAELEATIDSQTQEIARLKKQNNLAKGISYFIGFVVASGLIVAEVVR
jgi:DNA repair exonuclease SbcCD ATPase subunit